MSRTSLIDTGNAALISGYDGLLLDLDGVVYRGPHAVEHAPESIEAVPYPVGFVTNNAGRTPQAVADHLVELGVSARPEQVTTAAQAGAAYARDTYGTGARVLMVGGEGLATALREAGLELVASADDDPKVVVQGNARTITWAELAEAVYAINAGAAYVATNLDSTMPTERGMALGNGAMIAAVTHATGVEPEYSAGKPQPGIFQHAAKQQNMQRPIVVGDRLDTDIHGANAAGFDGALVLSGVTNPADAILADPVQRPAYILRDLRGLHESQSAPAQVGNAWIAGDSRAWVDGERLYVSTSEGSLDLSENHDVTITLDGLRTACAAAWNAKVMPRVEALIHIAD